MLMTEAIAAHRAAWQAFQDSTDEEAGQADDEEGYALDALLTLLPQSIEEVQALKEHLDWYCEEERDRFQPGAAEPTNVTNLPFAVHAALTIALAQRENLIGNAARPVGIPQDLWDQAHAMCADIPSGEEGVTQTVSAGDIARELMAERDRCKRLAHREAKRHGEGPEAVVALENCAGHPQRGAAEMNEKNIGAAGGFHDRRRGDVSRSLLLASLAAIFGVAPLANAFGLLDADGWLMLPEVVVLFGFARWANGGRP